VSIPFAGGFVDSDGERIYYETAGDGDDVVVLCHGAGGNHASWWQQVPVFATRFRVVAWDHRGFGRSTDAAQVSGPDAAVRDLEALTAALGVERAHLVAQSMGGWTALGFALAHPERVRSLVLADTVAGIWTAETERAHDDFVARAASEWGRPPELGRHVAVGQVLAERDPARAFLYQEIGGFAEPDIVHIGARLRATAYEHGAVADLRCSVLFVVGRDDPIFPPGAIRSAAAVVGEDTEVVEIPACGHSPYFEDADAWNEAVLAFLVRA